MLSLLPGVQWDPADLAADIERAKALIEVSAIAWSDGWCMSDDQDAEPVSVAPGHLTRGLALRSIELQYSCSIP